MIEDIKSFGVENYRKVKYDECYSEFNKLLTTVKSLDQSQLDLQKELEKVEIKVDGVEISGDFSNPNWIYLYTLREPLKSWANIRMRVIGLTTTTALNID